MDEIEKLATLVATGHAILLVGAGGSSGSTSSKGHPVPLGDTLRNVLLRESEVSNSKASLSDLAQHFIAKKGSPTLHKILSDHLILDEPNEMAKLIASMSWKRIYTTNYDNNIEAAFAKKGVQPITVDLDSDPRQPISNNSIIHLNGSIVTCDARSISEKLTLTNDSYIDEKLTKSGWLRRLASDLQNCRAFIFVGYSLADFPISKILKENPDLSRKIFFLDREDLDEITLSKFNSFGTVIDGNAFEILSATSTAIEHLEPKNDIPFVSFDLYERAEDKIESLSANDARQFLVAGKSVERLSWLDDSVRERFICSRSAAEVTLDRVYTHSDDVVIYGGIGNGKSVFCYSLATELTRKGIECYFFKRRLDSFQEEISELGKRKCVVFFSSLFDAPKEVEYARLNLPTNIPLVVSCRTAAYDLRFPEIKNLFGEKTFHVSVDGLTQDERLGFSKILEAHGIWGKHDSARQQKKEQLISSWGNDIRSILLKMFEETNIAALLNDKLNAVFSGGNQTRDIMITIFAVKIVNEFVDVSLIDDCLAPI